MHKSLHTTRSKITRGLLILAPRGSSGHTKDCSKADRPLGLMARLYVMMAPRATMGAPDPYGPPSILLFFPLH